MARSSRSTVSRSSARTSATANDPLRSLLGPSNSDAFTVSPIYSSSLSDVEDFRRYNPDPDPDPRSVTGNRTWSVVSGVSRAVARNPIIQYPSLTVHRRPWLARDYYTNIPVGIQVPVGIKRRSMFPVAICVRRKIRKAVMFATRQTGKGSRSRKHFNSRSKVHC